MPCLARASATTMYPVIGFSILNNILIIQVHYSVASFFHGTESITFCAVFLERSSSLLTQSHYSSCTWACSSNATDIRTLRKELVDLVVSACSYKFILKISLCRIVSLIIGLGSLIVRTAHCQLRSRPRRNCTHNSHCVAADSLMAALFFLGSAYLSLKRQSKIFHEGVHQFAPFFRTHQMRLVQLFFVEILKRSCFSFGS